MSNQALPLHGKMTSCKRSRGYPKLTGCNSAVYVFQISTRCTRLLPNNPAQADHLQRYALPVASGRERSASLWEASL